MRALERLDRGAQPVTPFYVQPLLLHDLDRSLCKGCVRIDDADRRVDLVRQPSDEAAEQRHLLGLHELSLHSGKLDEAEPLDFRGFLRFFDTKADLEILQAGAAFLVERPVLRSVKLFVMIERRFEMALVLLEARERFV